MNEPTGVLERLPPSVEDLITDDGEPMESQRHRDQMFWLIESLRHAWRDRDDFYVSGNMFLYFSETQARNNDFRGPDVFIVLDTPGHERKAWVVWEEGGKTPDVVIELLSDTTRQVDQVDKKRIYGRVLRIPEYFLFDPHSAELEGFTLDLKSGDYVPIEPDSQGRLRSDRLKLWLGTVEGTLGGVRAPWLRYIDDEGVALPLPAETAANLERQAKSAELRASQAEYEAGEAQREREQAQRERDAAELARQRADERAAALAAKLRAAGIDPDEV